MNRSEWLLLMTQRGQARIEIPELCQAAYEDFSSILRERPNHTPTLHLQSIASRRLGNLGNELDDLELAEHHATDLTKKAELQKKLTEQQAEWKKRVRAELTILASGETFDGQIMSKIVGNRVSACGVIWDSVLHAQSWSGKQRFDQCRQLCNRLTRLTLSGPLMFEIQIRAFEFAATEIFAEGSMDWASTVANLGATYSERIAGEKRDNIEDAIKYNNFALSVFKEQSHPHDWASTVMGLGNAYSERIKGEKRDNIEDAIDHYKDALRVYKRQSHPLEWASTVMNLGSAYRARIKGEKRDNIEKAIKHYNDALKVLTAASFPVEFVVTSCNLASVYLKLGSLAEADTARKILAEAYYCFQNIRLTSATVSNVCYLNLLLIQS